MLVTESAVVKVSGLEPMKSVSALQFQIHNDLREQHPEWIQPNGDCPTCDFYEARLAELLGNYGRISSDEVAAAIHRTLEEQAIFNSQRSA
jgi:hypothetical protein